MNPNHYVCEGECKSVSENPGVCQADFCNKKGEELAICGCEDGTHTKGEHPIQGEEVSL